MKSRIHAYTTAVLVAVAAAALVGCRANEPVGTSSSPSAKVASVPTLTQITRAVSLDDGDRAVVASALDDWQGAAAERSDKPFRQIRAGMDFVATVAPSLDNEQLSDLVDFLAEYRDQRMKEMRSEFHARRGDGKRDKHREKLTEALGLSEEQQAAMEAIHEEAREKMREQHQALRDGNVDEGQIADAMRAIHEAKREKLAEILTEEQLTRLDALREERRMRRLDRRLEHMGDRVDARAEWFTAVLGLTAEQRATLEGAMEQSVAERKAALEDAAPRREMRVEMREHHDSVMQTLAAILTPEQAERLEIVRRLHPRKHGE